MSSSASRTNATLAPGRHTTTIMVTTTTTTATTTITIAITPMAVMGHLTTAISNSSRITGIRMVTTDTTIITIIIIMVSLGTGGMATNPGRAINLVNQTISTKNTRRNINTGMTGFESGHLLTKITC